MAIEERETSNLLAHASTSPGARLATLHAFFTAEAKILEQMVISTLYLVTNSAR